MRGKSERIIHKKLFETENSQSLKVDEDARRLYTEIIKAAEAQEYIRQAVPVRWFKLLDWFIHQKRDGAHVTTKQMIAEREHLKLIGDLTDALLFFHSRGDIIYKEEVGDLIVLDQSFLVDWIINCREICGKMDDLQLHQGIREEELMKIVLKRQKQSDVDKESIKKNELHEAAVKNDKEIFIKLLVKYDLVVPVNIKDELRFFIPSLLEPSKITDIVLWTQQADDKDYFFDFGVHTALPIFHRLVARCWTMCYRSDSTANQPHVFNNKATFKFFRQSCSIDFLIAVRDESPEQHVIQLAFRGAPTKGDKLYEGIIAGLFQQIRKHVAEIQRRDFKNLKYTIGFLNMNATDCPFEGKWAMRELNWKHIHLVKLSDENGSFPDPTTKFIAKGYCGTRAPQPIEIVPPLPLDDKEEQGQVHSEHPGTYNSNSEGSSQEAFEKTSDQDDLGSKMGSHLITSHVEVPLQATCTSRQALDSDLRKRSVNMPQRMTKDHQSILDQYRSSIVDALELEATITTVMDILIEKRLLSHKDCQIIEAEKVQFKKARQLTDIIKGKHDDAFFIFIEAVQNECGFSVIYD